MPLKEDLEIKITPGIQLMIKRDDSLENPTPQNQLQVENLSNLELLSFFFQAHTEEEELLLLNPYHQEIF